MRDRKYLARSDLESSETQWQGHCTTYDAITVSPTSWIPGIPPAIHRGQQLDQIHERSVSPTIDTAPQGDKRSSCICQRPWDVSPRYWMNGHDTLILSAYFPRRSCRSFDPSELTSDIKAHHGDIIPVSSLFPSPSHPNTEKSHTHTKKTSIVLLSTIYRHHA